MAGIVLRPKAIDGQVCEGHPRARFLILIDGREYEMFPREITVTIGGRPMAEVRLTGAVDVGAAIAISNSF